jgi:hypothetical protein
MATKVLKSVKGRTLRLTRLDECGVPVIGSCSVIVTTGFVRVTLSAEVEAGQELSAKNAWGEYCVNEKDADIFKWINATIDLCEVDPNVLDMFAGANPIVNGADTIGASFGPTTNADAVAVEVWTKQAGQDACAGGTTNWGYFVVPYIKNGRVSGDVTIENAPLSFQVQGQGFPAVDDWGVNPHDDNPLLVAGGMPTGDFWAQVVTTVQPPAATAGCTALAA